MARTVERRHVPISYRVLRGWARLAIAVLYRQLDVTGSRPPKDRAVILAANHGNALADVAIIIAKMPEFPHFLAAASWWKSAPVRVLFQLGGVVPVQRRREGGDTHQNTSAFEACHQALASGAEIAIFPEGEMHVGPSLLPLKTGAARIALGGAAEAGLPGVVLVPVGIIYDDRERFRSDVEIHFGEAIEIDDWLEEYRADPATAVRAVTDLLADRLAQAAVNHASANEAALLDEVAALTLADASDARGEGSYARRNALRRELASSVALAGGESSADYNALAAAVDAHKCDLLGLGIDDASAVPLVEIRAGERIRLYAELVVLTPPAALGLVANGPTLLVLRIASGFVRHETWQATTKGVGGSFLSPVVWALEFAFLSRHLDRRRAFALTTAGAFAGLAALAWKERVSRFRLGRRAFREGEAALEAARASRALVCQRVASLVGNRAGVVVG